MPKRQDIELLRIVSAFGIVWFHSGAVGSSIAYTGLIVFVVLSMYFFVRRGAGSVQSVRPEASSAAADTSSAASRLAARAGRLLVPWLAWFGFYALFNLVTHRPIVQTAGGPLAAVLTGPSIHLWYLPFIFIVMTLAEPLLDRLTAPVLAWSSALLATLDFAAVDVWRPYATQLGAPYSQYFHALPAVLAGVYLACCQALPSLHRNLLLYAMLFAAALTWPEASIAVPYVLGISICAAVLSTTPPLFGELDIGRLSACALGIYLIHPFLLGVVLKFRLATGVGVPVLVFALSLAAIWFARSRLPSLARRVL